MKKVVLLLAAVLMIAAISIQVYALGGVKSYFVNDWNDQFPWVCPNKENSHNGHCWICTDPSQGCTEQWVSSACWYCRYVFAPYECEYPAGWDGGPCNDVMGW